MRDEFGTPVSADQMPGRVILREDVDEASLLVRNIDRETGELRWFLMKTRRLHGHSEPLAVNLVEDLTAIKKADLRQRLLSDSGRILASSLDFERTLQEVAQLAVPQLADWCGVDMPGPHGEIRPVAIAHGDPAKVALGRELRRRLPCRSRMARPGCRRSSAAARQLAVAARRRRGARRITPPTSATSSCCAPSGFRVGDGRADQRARRDARGAHLRLLRARAVVRARRPGARRGAGPARRDGGRQRARVHRARADRAHAAGQPAAAGPARDRGLGHRLPARARRRGQRRRRGLLRGLRGRGRLDGDDRRRRGQGRAAASATAAARHTIHAVGAAHRRRADAPCASSTAACAAARERPLQRRARAAARRRRLHAVRGPSAAGARQPRAARPRST